MELCISNATVLSLSLSVSPFCRYNDDVYSDMHSGGTETDRTESGDWSEWSTDMSSSPVSTS